MNACLRVKRRRVSLFAHSSYRVRNGCGQHLDPLAGSYFVEALTDKMEAEAEAYFKEIEARGGVSNASKTATSSRRSPRRLSPSAGT